MQLLIQRKAMKNRKLFLKIFIPALSVFTVAVFFSIFILIWFVGDRYKDFDSFNKEFAIQGLDEGAIPQGITSYQSSYTDGVDSSGKPINKTQQYFLVSAYMNDGSPSRIYVTGQTTGYVGYVTMKNTDGSDHFGHVGGIATNGARLWVAYNDSVLVAKASTTYSNENILKEIVDKAEKNSGLEKGEELYSVQFTTSFNANCRADFLYYCDDSRYTGETYDRLYVGEFYRKGNYETAANHRYKTPKGYKNNAFMYEYNVDNNTENPYGLTRIDSTLKDTTISNNVPKIQKIFSLPEKIQGIAFSGRTGYSTNDGYLVLSQSYGLSNSHLLCFDWKKINETSNRTLFRQLNNGYSFEYADSFKIKNSTGEKTPYTDPGVYVYYVDKGNSDMFVKDYSIPCMSEGMCIVTTKGSNNQAIQRIYVLFESASKKYRLFTREKIKNVYSFVPHVY